MSYTYTQHTHDGVQVTWPFRFAGRDKGYIRAADIRVEMKTEKGWEPVERWQLSGTNQITLNEPLPAGMVFRIRRVVGKEQPYSEFDRGVILDMKSLNNCFIQNLEAVQEILDGFWPEGYYVKDNLDMGNHKIINLQDGSEPKDAVNKGQLDELADRQDVWNTEQDLVINSIIASLASEVAQRTIPWMYTANGGETELHPPFLFESALLFINGVLQHQLDTAFKIENNTVVLSEALEAGDKVYLLIGSRPAAPSVGAVSKVVLPVEDGTLSVDLGTKFAQISVYLDGLYQPETVYGVDGTRLVFKEQLPSCTLSAELTQA